MKKNSETDLSMKLTCCNLFNVKLDDKFDTAKLEVSEIISPCDLCDNERYDLLLSTGNSLHLSRNMRKKDIFNYVGAWRRGYPQSDFYISPTPRRKK